MPNVFLNTLPCTEEAAKLVLTEDIEKNCRVVYHITENGDAVFHSLWNPKKDYSDEFVIVPFRSTGAKLSEVEHGVDEEFANVKNSFSDPCPDTSWIEILRKLYIGTDYSIDKCCTNGKIYDSTGAIYSNVCTDKDGNAYKIIGGHIIFGKITKKMPPYNKVYLLPICSHHNTKTPHGDSEQIYYMKLAKRMKPVELEGYFPKSVIQAALAMMDKG